MRQVFSNRKQRTVALGLAVLVALGGSAIAFTQKPKQPAFTPPLVDKQPIARELGGHNSFAPIVKKVSPGVVKVYTTIKARPASLNGAPPDMDDFFRRFFGDPFNGRAPNQRRLEVPRQMGIGSGVIVTGDGYILTNNHVVDGADEVKVALQDGREFTAKVVGRDPKTDVAVIKVEATNLPIVPMADSDQVEVGDVVLAVGNPFGIGQTVTTGIVSATGRGGALGLDYEDFIQTDAAINPGNSGGALVDTEGRLIGLNTAILSRSGGNQGIGFAIPTNLARYVMTSLIQDGKVTRGYLGVLIQDLTPALAKEFKLKSNQGALVGEVTPQSPAARAGLKEGDVITDFNGKSVADSRHLKLEVASTPPGDNVPVQVIRNGQRKTLEVTLKEAPGARGLAQNNQGQSEDTGTLNGVAVADLDARARQELNVPSNIKGVVVSDVAPDSAAAEAGLQRGDVILEINRKAVKSAEEAVKMTESADSKTTLLRVWRNGASRFVVVDEGEKAG